MTPKEAGSEKHSGAGVCAYAQRIDWAHINFHDATERKRLFARGLLPGVSSIAPRALSLSTQLSPSTLVYGDDII
ncbi:hypothetical protein ACU8KH_04553 [Lachancea thermotolerans]